MRTSTFSSCSAASSSMWRSKYTRPSASASARLSGARATAAWYSAIIRVGRPSSRRCRSMRDRSGRAGWESAARSHTLVACAASPAAR